MAVVVPFEVDSFGNEVLFFRTRPDYDVDLSVTLTEDEGGTILGVTASFDDPNPDMTVTGGTDTVTFSGQVTDPFEDSFFYVDKGKSDKTDTVKTVIGVSNVPENKELFDLDQDVTTYYENTITFQVTYENADGDTVEEDVTMGYTIFNEYEGIRSFMDTYYD